MALNVRMTALLAAAAVTAWPAMAQDIQAGEKIAQTWCAGCHQVGPHPDRANDSIPSFAGVAASKGMTLTALTVFLNTPHGKMPDYSLSRQQIRDVSAYIVSLKP